MITLILQNGSLKRDKFGYISQLNNIVKSTTVENFAEASKLIRDYIDYHDLGGSTFTGGAMYGDDGKYIGRVSYNGRVWDPDDNEIKF